MRNEEGQLKAQGSRLIAYLGLGSNIGDRRANIDQAIEMLKAQRDVEIIKASSIYETAPVGYRDQPDFLNAVVMIETRLKPRELLNAVLSIESLMGRKRTIRWGPRVIDIDILLYDNEQLDEDDLHIPHPRMLEREFVMKPLAEIAPDLILPDGRTASEAAREVKK